MHCKHLSGIRVRTSQRTWQTAGMEGTNRSRKCRLSRARTPGAAARDPMASGWPHPMCAPYSPSVRKIPCSA